jgi:hypothetical protein
MFLRSCCQTAAKRRKDLCDHTLCLSEGGSLGARKYFNGGQDVMTNQEVRRSKTGRKILHSRAGNLPIDMKTQREEFFVREVVDCSDEIGATLLSQHLQQ